MPDESRSSSRFIVNPWYDTVFFIGAPLIALALGILIADTPLANEPVKVFGHLDPVTELFIGSFIMAHLVLVFVRSHGNQQIFHLYPVRFTVVPMALFTAMMMSRWVLISVSVLATFWDVFHSSMQTFGLARIYDQKRGNQPLVGRRLDIWLNHYLYISPILAGATLMDHVEDFYEFEAVGSVFFTSIPARVESYQGVLTWLVVWTGIPFFLYYLFTYWRLHRQGYHVSLQKVALLVSTGLCSIYTWGFNSFGEAFFIMNFFHALQYFALVWKYEHTNLVTLLRLEGVHWGKLAALLAMVGLTFGYGFLMTVANPNTTWLVGISVVVSIMHFWYDGFIWSVRKGQV